MSRRLISLFAVLFVFSLVAAACGSSSNPTTAASSETSSTTTTAPSGDSGALPDLGGQKITIAIENAYLPFNYIDTQTNKGAGWDYSAIDEMCVRLNCTPDFVSAAWDGMIVAVSDGQYDMAADGITITPDRAKVVDFSDGYINIDQRMLVRVDESRFTSADELAANPDLRIGSQVGTTNYDTAVSLVGADRVDAFDQFGFAVQALIAGDVDAVIMDETAGQGYVGKNANDVKLMGDSLSSDQLGFIFPKGSDLVAAFNAVIAQMKADGSLASVSQKFFGDSFTITYDDIADVTYSSTTTTAAP